MPEKKIISNNKNVVISNNKNVVISDNSKLSNIIMISGKPKCVCDKCVNPNLKK